MDTQAGIHCIVTGRVQGVFFRAFTQEKALELGLTGWVRNLNHGDVELKAFGDQPSLDLLLTHLKLGPPSAAVKHLEMHSIPYEKNNTFEITY